MIFILVKSIIDQLRVWFVVYGFFEEVVFDNGFQFIVNEFVDFFKQNGVKQILVFFYYLLFNGVVECIVQIFK